MQLWALCSFYIENHFDEFSFSFTEPKLFCKMMLKNDTFFEVISAAVK